jgi:hypothetical protein
MRQANTWKEAQWGKTKKYCVFYKTIVGCGEAEIFIATYFLMLQLKLILFDNFYWTHCAKVGRRGFFSTLHL